MKNVLFKMFWQCKWKLILILLHIIIIVSFFGNTLAYRKYANNNICKTKGCRRQAVQLRKLMNPKIDPCKDFYAFTCGNFIKETIIPADASGVDMFAFISGDLVKKLKYLFEQPISANEHRYSVLVKEYYQACMDRTRTEGRKLKPIKKILQDVIGGWPVVHKSFWKNEYFDWQLATQRCAKIGCIYTAFISIDNTVDSKNSTKNVLKLRPASLGLNRDQFLSTSNTNKKIRNAYFTYMVHVAVIFGARKYTAQKELIDAFLFEKKLAKISLSHSERRNDTLLYNPMTIKEMYAKYPNVNWLKYINEILQPIEGVGKDDTVIIEEPYYIKKFLKLIANTSKRTLANYMAWRIIKNLAPFLTDAIRKEELKLQTSIQGISKNPQQWIECVDVTRTGLGKAVDAMYIQKYFNKKSKTKILELVANIREQFTTTLKQLKWMDIKSKKSGLDKALAMSQIIAHSDELLNNQLVNKFYANLQIDKNYFLESYLNITTFNKPFDDLHNPVNKTDWKLFSATAVNAYYARFLNSIRIPAGILQGVFFDNDRPNYMNFGAIGFVIGHEIIHGFDDQGQERDKDGNLVAWWEPKTKDAFLKRAKCFIDQYGAYTIPEIHKKLDGVMSQGENIADNGGIKQSYYAYKKWIQRHGPEPILPGLSFTPEQMFWISAASVWCEKKRPESLKTLIATNEHLPGRYRVLGTFSNQKEFAKDFNCPVGSTMNPRKKCQIW